MYNFSNESPFWKVLIAKKQTPCVRFWREICELNILPTRKNIYKVKLTCHSLTSSICELYNTSTLKISICFKNDLSNKRGKIVLFQEPAKNCLLWNFLSCKVHYIIKCNMNLNRVIHILWLSDLLVYHIYFFQKWLYSSTSECMYFYIHFVNKWQISKHILAC